MIIPKGNERDLKEIPDNIKADMEIHPVMWIDEVLEIALQEAPTPMSDEDYFKASTTAVDEKDGKGSVARVSTH